MVGMAGSLCFINSQPLGILYTIHVLTQEKIHESFTFSAREGEARELAWRAWLIYGWQAPGE